MHASWLCVGAMLQITAAGNVDAARSTYRMVVGQLSPGLVEAVVEFANFERRQGDVPAAKKVYEDALTAAEAKEGEPSQAHKSSAARLRALPILNYIELNQINLIILN